MVHYGRAPSCNWDVLPNCTPQVPPPMSEDTPIVKMKFNHPSKNNMWSENVVYLCIPPKWVFMYGKYAQLIILSGYLVVPYLHPKPDNYKTHQKKGNARFTRSLSQKRCMHMPASQKRCRHVPASKLVTLVSTSPAGNPITER